MYDIFLPGDYFFDLIYTGLPSFPVLGQEVYGTGIISTGGGMYITAASLHRLEVKTAWPAVFGNDYYSRFVYEIAREAQIDLSLSRCIDAPYRRVSTSIPYEGERAFVTYIDPAPLDMHAFWLERMQQVEFKHLHLGGLMSIDELTPLAAVARTRGATITMDCQDVPVLHTPCAWCDLLALVDVFLPNAREALIVSGTSSVHAAIHQIMAWVEAVVVKDGANGAWIGTGGQITHVPAINAGPVIDTTGAGDCFNAGFLRGYVVEQKPLLNSVCYANICGGLSVTGVGGATAAPAYDQLQAWLSACPDECQADSHTTQPQK
ncbi:MAG: carbohydrate kinase family protein [Chloroflexi bacterium]|nr:carbohydrate kinase family protein [Chloroflexota bacterium]